MGPTNPSAANHPTSTSAGTPAEARGAAERTEGPAGQTEALLETAKRSLLGNYRPAPVVFSRGEGTWLFDTMGESYLDFTAGVAVNILGHAHPDVVATVTEQAARLMHVSNYFYNEENVRCAEELCAISGYDRAFFCNSGGEANEAMLKLARRFHFISGAPQRLRFIAFENAFHGRTFATVNLGGTPSYREGFGPFESVTHLPYGDLSAVAGALGDDVAGIFVEPVQGEGGVLPAPEGFLLGLRELCDRSGALLLLDEVQTGIGRTGRVLGSSSERGRLGDAASLAKGLGAGFPIGALLVTERIAGALTPGTHGSTFGGNPLGSAVARTVLRHLTPAFLADVTRKGELLGGLLDGVARRFPGLCEGERGVGLMRGLVLKKGIDAREVLGRLRQDGLLVTLAGSQVLRFTPPLNVTEEEIHEAERRLVRSLSGVSLESLTS